MTSKEKLDGLLAANPDPKKWSKWLKVLIKVLIVLASALGGDAIEITNLLNLV